MPSETATKKVYSKADIQNKLSSAMIRIGKGRSKLQAAIWLVHDAIGMLSKRIGPSESATASPGFHPFHAVGDFGSLSPITERMTRAIGVIENERWAEAIALLQAALPLLKRYAEAKGMAVKMEPTPMEIQTMKDWRTK